MLNMINRFGEDLSCRSENVIFLLSCKSCTFQVYVPCMSKLTTKVKLKLDVNML